MSTGFLIFLGIFLFGALAIVGYFITIYNGLISLKENIKKSWSNIDVILKQRHDELPKLISVCESYSEFEKGILDRLMNAREKYFKAKGVARKSEASNEVTAALQGIFALAENYPDLESKQKLHAASGTHFPSGGNPGGPAGILQRQRQQLQYQNQTDSRRSGGRNAQLSGRRDVQSQRQRTRRCQDRHQNSQVYLSPSSQFITQPAVIMNGAHNKASEPSMGLGGLKR